MSFTPFYLVRFFLPNFAGSTSMLVGNLVLLALGAGIRLAVTERRSFRIAAAVLAAGWAVLEVIADIAVGTEIGMTLTSLSFTGGRFFLMAGVGFFLCHLVCTLLHRRPVR